MSGQQYRVLLAGANVLLVIFIGLLGVRLVVGREVPPRERPPANFDPIKLAIESKGGGPNTEAQFRVVAQQLDRPDPPPAARRAPPPGGDPGPRVDPRSMANRYSLVMASYDPKDKARSSVILKDTSQNQFTVAVGDDFDGFQVVDIVVQGHEEGRTAVVTLAQGATRHTIELKRQPQ